MRRAVRRVILTIGVTLGVVLGLFINLWLLVEIPPIQQRIRSRIESELGAQLDREVLIGEVHLGFMFSSLDFRDVRIASRKRLEDGVLAEVQSVQIYPNLADLLRFRLSLGQIVVRRPTVNLPPPEAEPAPPTPAQPFPPAPSIPPTLPLGIQHVEIRDGSVTWQETDTRISVAGLYAEVVRAPAGAISGTLRIEQGRIEVGTTPFSLRDLVLEAALGEGDIQVKEFQVTALGADVLIVGRLASFLTEPTLDLTLRMRGELGELFPQPPPFPLRGIFLLVGKASGPVADPSFSGQAVVGSGQVEQIALSGMTVAVQANRREVHLKQLTLRTASGNLSGDVAVTWDKFRYDLAIHGERVDLAEVLRVTTGDAPVGGEATIRVQAKGEGTDLTKIRGRGNVRVEEFHLSDHPKDRGHVHFVLDGRDGRVHVREGEVEVARTRLRTTGVVKLGGDLDLDVDMRFSKLEDFGRLLGAAPGDVDGQATIKGRLTGSVADPVLRGTLDWTKGILLEVALDRVRGPVEVAFARRTLTTPSLTVRRQNLRGDLQVGLVLAPKPPDRKILLKYDLTLDIDGDVEGPVEELLGIFAKGVTFTSGSMRLKTQVQGTPDTLRGQGTLDITDYIIFSEPWERFHATVNLERQQEKVLLDHIELQRGRETVAGRFEIGFDGVAQWDLRTSPLTIQRLTILKDSGLTGTVQIPSLKGEGPIGKPRVAAELDIADLGYRGVGLGRGHGTLTWQGSQGELTGRLLLPERGYQLQANLTTTAPQPYEVNLTLDKGDLWTLLHIVQGPLPVQMSAVGSGRIDVSGRLGEKAPERATVDLEEAQLDVQGHTFRAAGRTQLTFQDGQLSISSLSLAGEGGAVTAQGTIGEEMDLTFQGTAPLVLATIVSPEIRDGTGLLDLDVKVQGPRALRQIRGQVRTKDSSLTFRVHPEPIKDLAGDIRFTENSIETNDLQAQWAGGTIDATIQGKLEQDGWGWRLQSTLGDARVEHVLVDTREQEAPVLATGQLGVSATITTGGGADLLATLGGQVRFEMINGVIQRSFSLEKALKLVNLSFLFRKGPGEKGLPYNKISGTFDLQDGIASTENLRLDSPVLKTAAVGQIDLAQATVDGHAAVQPLQLTDTVIKAVSSAPIIKQVGIGTLLFGEKKAIMVLSYRVHGPLADPTVEKIETPAAQRGLGGIFERTLALPRGVLSGAEKDVEEGPTAKEEPPAVKEEPSAGEKPSGSPGL